MSELTGEVIPFDRACMRKTDFTGIRTASRNDQTVWGGRSSIVMVGSAGLYRIEMTNNWVPDRKGPYITHEQRGA